MDGLNHRRGPKTLNAGIGFNRGIGVLAAVVADAAFTDYFVDDFEDITSGAGAFSRGEDFFTDLQITNEDAVEDLFLKLYANGSADAKLGFKIPAGTTRTLSDLLGATEARGGAVSRGLKFNVISLKGKAGHAVYVAAYVSTGNY